MDVVVVPVVVVETVMSFPLETAIPPVVHMAVGELTRPPTLFDTVQVRLYIIPALAVPDLLTLVVITSGGTEPIKQYNYR